MGGGASLCTQFGAGTPADYTALRARIEALEQAHGATEVRVFYVALPPENFPAAIAGLGAAGLNAPAAGTRLVIEKPFGHDLPSSHALSDVVHAHFREEQVYRIDHYLGKETVQNMMVFRFANAMFETLFVHADEVEAAWSLFTPLLDGAAPVVPYPAGSDGPMEAMRLSSR